MGKENNLIVLVVGCPFLHINSNSVTVVWYGGDSSKYSILKRIEHKLIKNK